VLKGRISIAVTGGFEAAEVAGLELSEAVNIWMILGREDGVLSGRRGMLSE